MPRDLSLHVIHASITYLDGVCVANFVKRVGSWEGLPDDCQELFTYVGLYIFAVGRVEPCNFPIPIPISGGVVPCIGVIFQLIRVSTSLQSSLIWWNGCGENFLISRYLGKPIIDVLG